MVPKKTRVVLLCALLSLAHTFVPNRVLSSPWRCRVNDGVVRFASSDDSSLGERSRTFTESSVVVFEQLAVGNDSSFVEVEDLKQWGELQDLLSDDDISQTELEDMFAEITKDRTNDNKLDQAGFCLLYKSIDNLFEYDDDTEILNVGVNSNAATTEEELLSFLSGIETGPDKVPCGMDCTDKEREIIARMFSDLEGSRNNLVLKKNGKLVASDLIGDWDLLYTNSKALIRNKSLSGLVGSPSKKAEFSGVKQRLSGSKFLGFVEFIETFNAGTEEAFDVTITGEWELKDERNFFTGQPATAIKVDPSAIAYGSVTGMTEEAPVVQLGGGLSQGASWQSLGPIKLLDIIYLTEDLQIVRGNSNTEAIFVWKKCK